MLGYLVAVPPGGTRFCVLRLAMARNPSFSAACEADSEKEIGGLDPDLKVSST